MHRPFTQQQIELETLYRRYWTRIVRFCATRLSACPDGTAEEVAQDVFLAAHRALTAQRYRGDGALSAWLFGIARNLCNKVHRELHRQTTPLVLRHLEQELLRLEHELAYNMGAGTPLPHERIRYLQEQLRMACHQLERERGHLQQHLREALHREPPASPDAQHSTEDAHAAMQKSLRRLARRDRQAYTLLHMHVLEGITVRELAGLQGMSRSTVSRSLIQAKLTLRTVYQSTRAQH